MRLSLVALAVLATACVSRTPPQPPAPRDATSVIASMDHTWDAVIDMFAARNIPIRTIERVSGLIVTDPLRVGDEGKEWADCGKVNRVRSHSDLATYNVLVRGDSARSTVKATVRWTHWSSKFQGNLECSTTHAWERDFEAEIKERAEGQSLATGRAALTTQETGAPRPSAAEEVDSRKTSASGAAPPPAAAPRARSPTRSSATGRKTPGARAGALLPRSNADLLLEQDFGLAVADCTRLGLIVAYGESARDTLVVDLTDEAMTSNGTEYNLERLFDGYSRTTGGSSGTILELRHAGEKVGEYSVNGLTRSNWR